MNKDTYDGDNDEKQVTILESRYNELLEKEKLLGETYRALHALLDNFNTQLERVENATP